jgi:hypothetical protein
VIVVYPWRADGPGRATLGVVEDPRRARRLAAECLRSGSADSAEVEEALSDLGMRTLVGGYFRTGHRWRGRVGAGGRVRWTQVTGP